MRNYLSALFFVACAFLLSNCAKRIEAYHHLVAADLPASSPGVPPEQGVRVTYLGTNGYVLESADSTVLIDPYFSRYSVGRIALNAKIPPHGSRLNEGLAKSGLKGDVDAIVITHGHFDHLLDVPEIHERFGGKLIASKTSCHLAEAAGMPDQDLIPSNAGDTIRVGNVRIQVLPATHDKLFGNIPYPGYLHVTPSQAPVRPNKWVCGIPLSFVISMGGQRIYVESGGTTDMMPPPEAHGVDLAILGLALNSSQKRYADAVREMKPRIVLPSHQDNFFIPLDQGFRFAGVADFESILSSHRKANLEEQSRLILMDYFRPWTLQ